MRGEVEGGGEVGEGVRQQNKCTLEGACEQHCPQSVALAEYSPLDKNPKWVCHKF